MSDRQDLLDQIEDMNEASEGIRWRHNKEIKELIAEFLEKINGYLDTEVNDAIRYFLKVREEYKKRLKQ